jgi:hypothetical protein
MKSNWPVVRKTFVIGLLLTGGGIVLLVYTGWNDAHRNRGMREEKKP